MSKFEAHLTADVKHADTVEAMVNLGSGYKFSRIDGDAQMGAKPFCYVTAYEPNADRLLERMKAFETILSAHGVDTLRIKIERIVYDTKTGVDELTPVPAI